jgi:hypothetical protein
MYDSYVCIVACSQMFMLFECIKYLSTFLINVIKILAFKSMWLRTIKEYMLNNYLLNIFLNMPIIIIIGLLRAETCRSSGAMQATRTFPRYCCFLVGSVKSQY